MASETKQLKFLLSANAKQLFSTLKTVQKNFKVFGRQTKALKRSLTELAKVSLAPLALGLTAAAGAIKNSVSEFTRYGTEVDNVSRSLGVASDSLQAFRYAAELGGSSAEEMDGALAMLNKNLANAVAGKNKDLVALMDHLGLSMKDANGQMKTAADLMPEIADAIAKQTDQTAKSYIATQMFGRSGQNLIKTLSEGSKGLAQARQEAEELGIVLSQDDVSAATKFGDTLTKAKKAIQGVQLAIGSKLMPYLQPLVDSFIEWVKVNREWIASTITDAVRDLAESLREIDFKAIVTGAMDFVKTCVSIFNAIGGLKTVGIALATLFAGKLVTSIYAVGKALLFLAANPVGAIIMAITAVVAACVYLYKNWDKVLSYIKELWEAFADRFPWAAQVMTDAFNTVCEVVSTVWQSLKDVFNGIIDFVCNVFTGNWSDAWDTVKSVFTSVFNGLLSVAKAPINGVIQLINLMIKGLNAVSFSVPDWIPGIGGKTFSLDIPEIPALAKGGVVTKPTTALIGEGHEPEAVLPLSKLDSLLGGRGSSQSEIVIRVESAAGTSATLENSTLAPHTRLVFNTGATR